MDTTLYWIQDHILAIGAFAITSVLLYFYILERGTGARLSKKYRNSIFEAQSQIFLNATQYLIKGHKDLAIKEFLSAVDLNRETIETYFALGGLFRSNGEIEKAISIHRSLIARKDISESTRLRALKELAIDFDKGGLIDRAIETYKDVLKINRDQHEAVAGLCRIYEDTEDWDEAFNYRILLGKVGHENQSETISHILVQKAKRNFASGQLVECKEDLEDAFRFAPTVSAKILQLKLYLTKGAMEEAKVLLLEILREHPMYATFVMMGLKEKKEDDEYHQRLRALEAYFLQIQDQELSKFPSIILSKIRLLKNENRIEDAYEVIKNWIEKGKNPSDVIKVEYIKLLIKMGRIEQALKEVIPLLDRLHQSLTRHFCSQCGYNSDNIFWRCPQCHEWETIQFRWKV